MIDKITDECEIWRMFRIELSGGTYGSRGRRGLGEGSGVKAQQYQYELDEQRRRVNFLR